MRRVLLVEDHQPFRRALALVLRLEGMPVEIEEAGSFSEARPLARLKDRYAVALVDLGLPDGEGLELIRDLRKNSPGTTVAVLTIRVDPEDLDGALAAGAAEIISKERPLPEIVATVKRLAGA